MQDTSLHHRLHTWRTKTATTSVSYKPLLVLLVAKYGPGIRFVHYRKTLYKSLTHTARIPAARPTNEDYCLVLGRSSCQLGWLLRRLAGRCRNPYNTTSRCSRWFAGNNASKDSDKEFALKACGPIEKEYAESGGIVVRVTSSQSMYSSSKCPIGSLAISFVPRCFS